ncbi:MAG: xanthan lyase [Bacteroidales bacterium]
MNLFIKHKILYILFILIFSSFTSLSYSKNFNIKSGSPAIDNIADRLKPATDSISIYLFPLANIKAKIELESVNILPNGNIEIFFNSALSEYPLRDIHIKNIYSIINEFTPSELKGHKVHCYSKDLPIETLSSAYFSNRVNNNNKQVRKDLKRNNNIHLVSNLSIPYKISKGLEYSHLALWHSHGYYYNKEQDRWIWQRCRLFQTVEDIYTQSYVLPFIVPMLENAGATVLLPRERDSQTNMYVIDNDNINGAYRETSYNKYQWSDCDSTGYKFIPILHNENPFHLGTTRQVKMTSSRKNAATASWFPNIKKNGNYAVYISYQSLPNSTKAAKYIVKHSSGEDTFIIDQSISGSTWVYLGTFYFNANNKNQSVSVYNTRTKGYKYKKGSILTADAVRLGGGYGAVSRSKDTDTTFTKNSTSGFPAYAEAARYYLQSAGFSPEVYASSEDKNDYQDDYLSRGLWVNELLKRRVPIDLSLALHSDAGTTPSDSTIGTLAIYSSISDDNKEYPTGEPREISRELADIVQTQIVTDIRKLYDPDWSRRGLWDKLYFEARLPETPTVLIEILSHQNFADMRYGKDPSFKFNVSRSIYKGVLKYLSYRYNLDYDVQPLPVKDFSAIFINNSRIKKQSRNNQLVQLSWTPVLDPLESTANPTHYIIYTRIDGQGFDHGVITDKTQLSLPILSGHIYSFKVCALNEGGKSFPSEILSAAIPLENSSEKVLIVNCFNRLSGPANFSTKDSTLAGFDIDLDAGVCYKKDFSFTGRQHEFRRSRPWLSDDNPGFGSSYEDFDPKIVSGNSFDYPYVHGIALLKAGYAFCSTSRDALLHNIQDNIINDYQVLDFIMGKQISTLIGRPALNNVKYKVFTVPLLKKIKDYCSNGGNILISGSYIASDTWDSIYEKPVKKTKLTNILKIRKSVNNISSDINNLRNSVYSQTEKVQLENQKLGFNFYTNDSTIYSEAMTSLNKNIDSFDSLKIDLLKSYKALSLLEKQTDPTYRTKKFIESTLHYTFVTNQASRSGIITPYHLNTLNNTDSSTSLSTSYRLNMHPNENTYSVESPDGIAPCDENTKVIYRYGRNGISAGIFYNGNDYKIIALGFPIEALHSQKEINEILKNSMNLFFNIK